MAMLDHSLRDRRVSMADQFDVPGYRLQDEVGRGASGIVFKAQNVETSKTVAVKLVPLCQGSADVLRLDREIESLSRLSHPNIVSIETYGVVNNILYIVMNFVEGCTFSDLLQPGVSMLAKFWRAELQENWTNLALWGQEIANALSYMHQQRVFHRDLKPANLLLDRDGKCWIADFGLSKAFQNELTMSQSERVVGTPRFMAPEQLRGVVDPRSDLFSLGRSLYEVAMLGSSFQNSKTNQVDLPPIKELNPEIPEDLGKIIDKLCEQKAELRFQSASELVVVLDRFLDGKTPCDRRRPGRRMSEIQFKNTMRRRYQTAIVAGGIVFAVSLSGILLFQQANRPKGILIPPVENGPVASASLKSLATKLESTDSGFVEVVGEAIKHSFAEKTPDQELAKTINDKIDRIISHVSENGLRPGELDPLIQAYRNSSLSVADKVRALFIPLRESNLTDETKLRGLQTLSRFAKAILQQKIQASEAENMLSSLFRGNVPRLEQIVEMRFPERSLVSWLGLVDDTFGQYFDSSESTSTPANEVLNEILDRYLANERTH